MNPQQKHCLLDGKNLSILTIFLSFQLEGIKIISSGTDDYRHGAEIRPVLTGKSDEVFKKKEPMSPETH